MSSANTSGFTRHDSTRNIRAPRGAEISCRSWQTEAALRMLMNNLDREVAERPEELVVYGGIGRAARSWECFDRIVEVLRRLENDETLLVQSGKPVGVFKTHGDAPRVLIANSNLVPHWATWEKFNELDRRGLMMYGQMTAGSWIYIGSQGIVQGTCETFGAAGKNHFGGATAGRWILTGGLGGMGGAQPLAATMAGFSMLAVECDATRIAFRLRTKYLDREARTLDEALAMLAEAKAAGRAVSVGLLGNAVDVFEELVRRNVTPDLVTDQTSAHDPLNGYLPQGWTIEQWKERRASDPQGTVRAAKQSMAVQVCAMLEMQKRGAAVFDYGNNIRQMALEEGVADAFAFPGFVPAYIRPLFCEGIGPFRWVALSGDPEDIRRTDAKVKELIPDDAHLHRWLELAGERIAFQGLPARICWLGLKDRARVGLAFNEMVASGELKAPIVIGRDHLDSGSVASPNRETEAMLDGSDAVSDWPLLNGMLNVAGGATWVSIHHGGGVGMGFSQHAGLVIVCDGTREAARRIARVLRNDPGTGVMRHADAGYELAVKCALENGLDLPGVTAFASLPPEGGTTNEGTANEIVIAPGKMRLAELRRVAFEAGVRLAIDTAALPGIDAAAELVRKVVAEERVTYGINTGFGQLASERISLEDIETLQRNLVLSHAAGVGEALKPAAVRLILGLKINSLARGYSGVRRVVIDALIAMFNAGVLPVIPAKGSVGASGDLAPLAHLACVLIGEGEAVVDGKRMPAREALAAAKLGPLQLAPKEGLALLNGTQVSTALALLGLFEAEDLFAAAVVTGSLSVEAALGSRRPFDARIQEVRGHRGQIIAARAYRELLGASSEIGDSHAHCNKVQDPYSLRCQPQVMGACLTQMRQAAEVLESEANAVSDNPLVFADGKSGEILSGGNFHGEAVAFASDNLALALAEIGSMSERRIAMLIDKNLSSGLPAFLVEHGGVNSGFMLAQVTAAALASENKSLAHPASVDSIPTSANQEDHVSMATFAARRLGAMAENTTGIVAIEWLAACQGLDFRAPLKSSERLEEARALLRAKVRFYDRDRLFAPDIEAAAELVRAGVCGRFVARGVLMSRC